MKRVYGFIGQKVDERDFKFVRIVEVSNLPSKIDLRYVLPPVYDQGELGSCTANGIAAIIQDDIIRQHQASLMPSRLFIYFNERKLEGTINQDAGANIRDGIKTINTLGVCDEHLWPYNIASFKITPGTDCYAAAKLHKSLKYESVAQIENSLKSALANGLPVVFGFQVKASFESAAVAKTGVYTPKAKEQIMGGHCVVLVGYDDASKRFIVRNSWGDSWGQKGYFTMPYSEVLNASISSDFWVIETMS